MIRYFLYEALARDRIMLVPQEIGCHWYLKRSDDAYALGDRAMLKIRRYLHLKRSDDAYTSGGQAMFTAREVARCLHLERLGDAYA